MRVTSSSQSQLYYLFSDHLGSLNQTVDTNGVITSGLRYYPFGVTRAEGGTRQTELTFTGQREQAEIGLLWIGSRWYDAALGRWVQPDMIVPIESQGVQAWDRYGYVNNSPINYDDPTGHCIGPLAIVCVGIIEATPAIMELVFYGLTALTVADQISSNPTVINGEPVDIGIFIPPGLALSPKSPSVATSESKQPLALPDPKTVNSRTGEVVSSVLQEDTVVYRVWGGVTKQEGRWFTPNLPTDQLSARQGLALPPENSAQYVSSATLPSGTRIQTSTAKGIFNQPGGWEQIELLNWTLVKFGETRTLPPGAK